MGDPPAPAPTWYTVIDGTRVELPATIPAIRAALTEAEAIEFDTEIARTAAPDLPLALARWALSPTNAAAEDEAVFARLAAGDLSGFTSGGGSRTEVA